MKEQNYWNQFLSTGNIDDYLNFKNKEFEEKNSECGKNIADVGDNPYAGICEIDRNGVKDGAYRGIR